MNDEPSYFSVAYQLNLNVAPLPWESELPEYSDFINAIPESFRLASAGQNRLENIATPLQTLGEAGVALQHYLHAQAEKLNMLMSYVLSLQDDPHKRTHTTHFGGSQLQFNWPEPLRLDQLVEIKLFIPEEATAIYCYGRVKEIADRQQSFNIACEYALIREEDQETLVRASLHVQSKLLQKRAKARHQQQ
ncbi:MAG: hypothetical protein CENE_03207 [Candidatus Celerinatantimonas neptuna]|nr:MAG: hypothetical protein CENE_03207 [Candidatus Celerinatantimonas neptuna]